MKAEPLKFVVLTLLATLLINPVITFIISNSYIIALGLYSLTLALCTLTFIKHRPLTPYFFHILFIFSLLFHAEAVFITNFKEYIIEDIYTISKTYYFNRPHLKKTFQDKEYNTTYHTSKQGFRIGEEDNPHTEIKTCDWMFLGDSYTQGAQVEYEDLYTTKLYKRFPNKVVLNCGISGWGLPDAYNFYSTEGFKYRPKKVFLQICNFNDFMNVKERERSFTDFLMSKSEFLRFVLYPFKYANPAELPLGRWTEPFYPTKELNEDYNVFFKTKSKKQMADLERFSTYLRKLNNEVKNNGAELIVFQIPTKEQLYYKFFEEVVFNFHIEVDALDMQYPNNLLADLCKTNSIQYIDLLRPLGEKEGEVFFQFDEHLNEYGHEALANILADFIYNDIKDPNQIPQMLSKHNSEDRYPIFQGLNIVTYQSVRDSNIELFMADSLLENEIRLTFNNVDEFHPWLDHKNSKIIFTEGNQETGETRIVSMGLNGEKRQYILGERFASIPSYDHRFEKIAFAEWGTDLKNRMTNPSIVVLNAKTQEKQVLTSDRHESWRPIFAPDDSSVYYISKRHGGNFDVYQLCLSTNNEENLTNTPYDEWDPFISGDGETLLYSGFKNGNWDIFMLDLTTLQHHQVTHTLGDEWDPSFSPDKKYIYYAGVYGFMNGIYRMSVRPK